MIAMSWRQHRAHVLLGAAVLAAIAAYLLITGLRQASYANSIGLTACLAARKQDCGTLAEVFGNRFGGFPSAFGLLAGLPLLAGLFWGAPLIAREVETGTHRLAWTQSVSRRRWLSVKLATFLVAVVIMAAVLSLSFSAWLSTYSQLSSAGYADVDRLAPPAFDLTGIAPLGTVLFAFAVGTAAGAIIRRTVPAMAVTIGGYLGVALPLESWRYTILRPLSVSGPFTARHIPVPPGAYTLTSSYATSTGRQVPFSYLAQACGTPHGPGEMAIRLSCLAAKGFRVSQLYQPASRYWPLQLICTASLAAAAIALLGVAFWWTVRRVS